MSEALLQTDLPTGPSEGHKKLAPGPNTLGSIKSGAVFLYDPFKELDRAALMPEPIVRYQLGKRGVLHLVHHPDHVEHILVKNHANYQKCTPYTLLKLLFGDGLLFNEGDFHLRQRRILQPSFQPKYFIELTDGVRDVIENTLKTWRARRDGHKIDIEEEMSELARRTIGVTIFGDDAPREIDYVMNSRVGKIGLLMGAMPNSPQQVYFRKRLEKLNKAIYAAIAKRRLHPEGYAPDMLTTLIQAKYKGTDEGMTDLMLRDEIVTLLIAGFDTTARTLSWVFHVLNENPEIEKKFHAELNEVLGGRAPVFDDIAKLTYTNKVVNETMRLYPPNPTIGRIAIDDDEVGGYHIPAGSVITLSSYLAQRNPEFWENPELADPERFSPENIAAQARFAYFPFGGGIRQCIGKGMAMMTIPMAVAMIAQEYKLRSLPGFKVQYDIKVTFRSRYRYFMTQHLNSQQV